MTDPTRERFQRALAVPLLRFIGAEPQDAADPAAGLLLAVTADSVNAAGVLHGGVIGTLLDLSAYLAVLPQLAPMEEAVTHSFSGSYVSSASSGDTVLARGLVLRRTRHLAFVTAELRAGERLVATASVIKSILSRG